MSTWVLFFTELFKTDNGPVLNSSSSSFFTMGGLMSTSFHPQSWLKRLYGELLADASSNYKVKRTLVLSHFILGFPGQRTNMKQCVGWRDLEALLTNIIRRATTIVTSWLLLILNLTGRNKRESSLPTQKVVYCVMTPKCEGHHKSKNSCYPITSMQDQALFLNVILHSTLRNELRN